MSSALYDVLRASLRSDTPVALVTVIDAGQVDSGTGDRDAGDDDTRDDDAGGAGTGVTRATPSAIRVSNKLLVRPGSDPIGSLGDPDLDRIASRDAIAELEAGRSGVRHYGPQGQTTPEDLAHTATIRVFVESWAPKPQMWIFGAVDFTAALARVARILGYRVTVCDARPVFATARRFPMADEVRVTWPGPMFAERGAELGARDAVCILTHDPKFDVPAIVGALATAVGYIGVMGSRRTHEHRLERLREAGVTDRADLDRLMSPIGLDIGARTPEETAVSIVAEIIAQRTGRNAPSLRDGSGPIHQTTAIDPNAIDAPAIDPVAIDPGAIDAGGVEVTAS